MQDNIDEILGLDSGATRRQASVVPNTGFSVSIQSSDIDSILGLQPKQPERQRIQLPDIQSPQAPKVSQPSIARQVGQSIGGYLNSEAPSAKFFNFFNPATGREDTGEPSTVGSPLKRGVFENAIPQLAQAGEFINKSVANIAPALLDPTGRKLVDLALPHEDRKTPAIDYLENLKEWSKAKIKPEDRATGKYSKPPQNLYDYLDPSQIYTTLGENAPLMIAQVGTYLANPVVGTLIMAGVEGGDAEEQIKAYEKQTGQTVAPILKNTIPLAVGAANAALEKVGLDEVISASGSAGRQIESRLIRLLLASGAEGSTETLQEAVQVLGELGYNSDAAQGVWDRLGQAFYGGALLGFIGGGTTQTIDAAKERGQIKRGQQELEQAGNIANQIQDNALQEAVVPQTPVEQQQVSTEQTEQQGNQVDQNIENLVNQVIGEQDMVQNIAPTKPEEIDSIIGLKHGSEDVTNADKIENEKSIASGQQVDLNPTEAQKEAGNYKKAHTKIGGLDVTIENPVGSDRTGTDSDGETWSVTMKSDYGYVKGSEGKDGDHVDVFIKSGQGENVESKPVFVVNQIDPKTGKFDEHKVMLGFDSEESAKKGYLENYAKDWQGIGSIVPMSFENFTEWVKSGKPKQGELKPVVQKNLTTEKKRQSRVAKGFPEQSKNELLNWFKGSKIKDKNSNPKILYHGTGEGVFDKFLPTSERDSRHVFYNKNFFFFTDDKNVAESYSYSANDAALEENFGFEYGSLTGLASLSEETLQSDDFLEWLKDEYKYDDISDIEDYDERAGIINEYAEDLASDYRDKAVVLNVLLNIANPKVIDADKYWNNLTDEEKQDIQSSSDTLRDHLITEFSHEYEEKGYDGLIIKNIVDVPSGEKIKSSIYVATNADQVKILKDDELDSIYKLKTLKPRRKQSSQSKGFPEQVQSLVDEETKNSLAGEMAAKDIFETEDTLNDKNIVSSRDVRTQLEKILTMLGQPAIFKTGKQGRRALGVFKTFSKVIRLRSWGDILVAAHETAHSIDDAMFQKNEPGNINLYMSSTDLGIGAKAEMELDRLGKELYGNTIPNGGYKSEGWAEFFAAYLVDHKFAQKKAPEFYKQFEEKFLKKNPKVADEIEKASELTQKYYKQGAEKRAASHIDSKAKESPFSKRRRNKVFQQLVEGAQPLYDLQKKAIELNPELKNEVGVYDRFSALRRAHSGIAYQWVKRGMTNLSGGVIGPSLEQAVSGIDKGKDSNDFMLYLWARRAIELWNRPEGSINPGITYKDASYIYEKFNNPRFQKAAENIYRWSDQALQYMVEAKSLSEKQYYKIKQDNNNYIPLQRVYDELAENWKKGSGSDPIKRIKGSGRPIRNPFQVLIENAEKMILKANQDMVLRQIVQLGNTVPGLGEFIERYPVGRVPINVSLEQVMSEAAKKGYVLELEDDGVNDSIGENVDIAGDDLITFWKPKPRPGAQDVAVIAYKDEKGTVQWYQLRPDLYQLLAGMDVKQLPKFIDATLGAQARAFKLGTTGLRAAFSFFTNPMRDVQTFIMQSQSDANQVKLLWHWVTSLKDAAQFMANGAIGKPSQEFEMFYRLGGQLSNYLGTDTKYSKRAARELFKSGGVIKALKNPKTYLEMPGFTFEILRDVFGLTESVSRVAEIKAMAKQVGWDGNTPPTLEQAHKLLLAAKQVTTDFTASGDLTRGLNQVWPFLNANIQGQRAFLRTIRNNPRKAALRAMINLTLPTLALWFYNRDEEWYQELTFRDKFGYYYIKFNDKYVLRVPRPFEWGAVFATLPEIMADSAYRAQNGKDTDKQLKALAEYMADTLINPGIDFIGGIPVPGIPAARMSAEILANEHAYFGTPITPKNLLNKPPEERFTKYTTETAKFLGKLFGKEPTAIDHVIRSTFGGVSNDILETLELPIREAKEEREFEPSDIPVFGAAFKRGGSLGTRSQAIEEAYDALEFYGIQRNKAGLNEDEKEQADLKYGIMYNATKAISALKTVQYATKELSKRQKIQSNINRIARNALKTVDSYVDKSDLREYKSDKKQLSREAEFYK